MNWHNRTLLAELAASTAFDQQTIITPIVRQTTTSNPFYTGGVVGGQEGKGNLTPVVGGVVMTPKVQSMLNPTYPETGAPAFDFSSIYGKTSPVLQPVYKKTPASPPPPPPPPPKPQVVSKPSPQEIALSAQQGALQAEFESLTREHQDLLKQLQMAEVAERQAQLEELRRQAAAYNEETERLKIKRADEARKPASEKIVQLVSEAWSGEKTPEVRRSMTVAPLEKRSDVKGQIISKIRKIQRRQEDIQRESFNVAAARVAIRKSMSDMSMSQITNAVQGGGR